jgi:hypothetical protein
MTEGVAGILRRIRQVMFPPGLAERTGPAIGSSGRHLSQVSKSFEIGVPPNSYRPSSTVARAGMMINQILNLFIVRFYPHGQIARDFLLESTL